MEWTVLISPIVSALVAVFGAYAATKRVADERERRHSEAIAEMRIEIKHLREEVAKHNQVIERTYKLETDVSNLYRRYAELHGDMKDFKIGGAE